jgi:hypothetical protein
MIEHGANAILRRAIDPAKPEELPRMVGKMWTFRFMKRLPINYSTVKQKPIN